MGKAKRERHEQKQQERERLRQLEFERQKRRRRLTFGLVIPLLLAIVIAGIFIASQGTKDAKPKAPAGILAGITQSKLTLGQADAPVTLNEYADLQCPVCQRFSVERLPNIIKTYVKNGTMKITYKPFVILGPDSQTAAEALLAASAQDRGWSFAESFYNNQKTENTGYVTDSFIHDRAKDSGIDNSKFSDDLQNNTDSYDETISNVQEEAINLGFQGTPSLQLVGPHGKKTVNDVFSKNEFDAAVKAVQ